VNAKVDDPSPLEGMSRLEVCFEVDRVFKNDLIRIALISVSVVDKLNNFVSYRSEIAM
jgi:hypothetical protein